MTLLGFLWPPRLPAASMTTLCAGAYGRAGCWKGGEVGHGFDEDAWFWSRVWRQGVGVRRSAMSWPRWPWRPPGRSWRSWGNGWGLRRRRRWGRSSRVSTAGGVPAHCRLAHRGFHRRADSAWPEPDLPRRRSHDDLRPRHRDLPARRLLGEAAAGGRGRLHRAVRRARAGDGGGDWLSHGHRRRGHLRSGHRDVLGGGRDDRGADGWHQRASVRRTRVHRGRLVVAGRGRASRLVAGGGDFRSGDRAVHGHRIVAGTTFGLYARSAAGWPAAADRHGVLVLLRARDPHVHADQSHPGRVRRQRAASGGRAHPHRRSGRRRREATPGAHLRSAIRNRGHRPRNGPRARPLLDDASGGRPRARRRRRNSAYGVGAARGALRPGHGSVHGDRRHAACQPQSADDGSIARWQGPAVRWYGQHAGRRAVPPRGRSCRSRLPHSGRLPSHQGVDPRRGAGNPTHGPPGRRTGAAGLSLTRTGLRSVHRDLHLRGRSGDAANLL